ncbi:MAG: ATP-dependent DNA helicase [bacterium]|nr:ATP-dependent DNA helicase [bacterium]
MNTPDLLSDLNEAQKSAVTAGEGPFLIIAGAGTGKTTVITRRIAWLILEKNIKPEDILALTFTEKAAGEMEERLDRLLPYGYVQLWISTFHAFCERIIRQHALDIGLPGDVRLLDQTALWLLMRRNLHRFNLEYYRPLGNPTKFLHSLIQHFSRAKDEAVSPVEYLALAENLILNKDTGATEDGDIGLDAVRIKEVADAYHVYEQLLLENNAMDFGGVITNTLKLFRERPAILEKYRQQFKYILVDEFQDTNWAQYELVKMLATPRDNLMVVGDDDQAVYAWRNASVAYIFQFKKDFPASKEVVLTNNYRSAQEILDCAYRFIQLNNPHRLEYTLSQEGSGLSKQLTSYTKETGIVEHIHCGTLEEEIDRVITTILQKKEKETLAWSDFAILVRSNDAALPFIERLQEMDLPYHFIAHKGLYTKAVIMDVLSYMRVLIHPNDGVSMYRVLNMPPINLSTSSYLALGGFAHKKGYSLWQAMEHHLEITDIPEEEHAVIAGVVAMINRHSGEARIKKAAELFLHIVKDIGYLVYLKKEETKETHEAFSYFNQFYKKIRTLQQEDPSLKLADVLEIIGYEQQAGDEGSLPSDGGGDYDAIKIMTIHASKGLEFAYVFLANMVDKRFPTISRNEGIPLPDQLVKEEVPEGDIHIEEERRLCYVGITRAKRGIYFTSAQNYGGVRAKKPSRFLEELGFVIVTPEGTSKDTSLPEPTMHTPSPAVIIPLPHVFSFSQLAAFASCPLQYKFAFILRIPTFGKASFSFGKSIHATLEALFRLILENTGKQQAGLFPNVDTGYNEKGTIPPWKTVEDLYEKSWIDEWYADRRTHDQYFEKGKEGLKQLHQDLLVNGVTPKAVERDFTLKMSIGSDQYSLKGRIDRVDMHGADGVAIIDYKTGTPKILKDLRTEDKEQLVLYQIACEDLFKEKVEELTYYYIEDGSRVSFLANEKEKEKLKERVQERIEAIRGSNFEPTPGFQCKFCDFWDICDYRQ